MKHRYEMFPKWPITHLHFSIVILASLGRRKKAFKTFVFAYHNASILGNPIHVLQSTFLENHEFYYIFPHFLCSLFSLRINNSNIRKKPKNRMMIQCLEKTQVHHIVYVFMILYKRKYRQQMDRRRWKMNFVMNFILWLLQSTFHFQSDIFETQLNLSIVTVLETSARHH